MKHEGFQKAILSYSDDRMDKRVEQPLRNCLPRSVLMTRTPPCPVMDDYRPAMSIQIPEAPGTRSSKRERQRAYAIRLWYRANIVDVLTLHQLAEGLFVGGMFAHCSRNDGLRT